MADNFLGEIRLFPYNFAPYGWAFCQGQLMSISQNTALFSLLGTMYGGDGKSTFGLPDLRSRVAVHQHQGPGLSDYAVGEALGAEAVSLSLLELGPHNHLVPVSQLLSNAYLPSNGSYGVPNVDPRMRNLYSDAVVDATAGANSIGPQGGGQPHNNLQPYLVMNYCIALNGIFPSRS